MKRAWAWFAVVALACACGSKKHGPPLAPLPPDQPVEEPIAKPDEPKGPADNEPVPRPVPTGPLDLKITYAAPTVKLVKPGTGKRVKLVVAPKQGAKQVVELALDFGVVQSVGNDSDVNIVPTVVLAGTAEVTAAAGDAKFALSIDTTDARAVTGAKVQMDKFREVLKSTVGLKIAGTVAPNGSTGEVALHVDKQGEATGQVLDLVRLTLPPWPPLPADPIAPGAKWQATVATKLADRLDITAVTDYELVSFKNNVWTIKGTTKITGSDQMMEGGKITKIAGSGTAEITWTDGQLFPSKHVSKVEATFTASEANPQGPAPAMLDFKISIGGAITEKDEK